MKMIDILWRAEWRHTGDCSRCINMYICHDTCEAHDEYLRRMAKKAMLDELTKRQARQRYTKGGDST